MTQRDERSNMGRILRECPGGISDFSNDGGKSLGYSGLGALRTVMVNKCRNNRGNFSGEQGHHRAPGSSKNSLLGIGRAAT